jgi:hypothetical protein
LYNGVLVKGVEEIVRSEGQSKGIEKNAEGKGSDDEGRRTVIGLTRQIQPSKALVWALVISLGVHGAVFWAVNTVLQRDVDSLVVIPVELVEWLKPKRSEPIARPEPSPPKETRKNSSMRDEANPQVGSPLTAEPEIHLEENNISEEMPSYRLQTFLKEAACPNFIDPQDLKTMDRCAASQSLDRDPPRVAQKIAQARLKRAIEKGWTQRELERFEDLEFAEGQSALPAPGAEVFGPWAWEE